MIDIGEKDKAAYLVSYQYRSILILLDRGQKLLRK